MTAKKWEVGPGNPVPAMRFEHARLRQYVPGKKIGDSPPDICRVTRVTRTTVYYRTADGVGTRYRIERDRLAEIVGAMLPMLCDHGRPVGADAERCPQCEAVVAWVRDHPGEPWPAELRG